MWIELWPDERNGDAGTIELMFKVKEFTDQNCPPKISSGGKELIGGNMCFSAG